MNGTSDQLIGIFNAALELAPRERAAYLDRVCGDDLMLREGVTSLLRAHDSAGGFLVEAVSVLHCGQELDPVVGEGVGDRVGKYKLLEQIGEGGCGVVFRAEQEKPVRRQVALKIVKPGMDTRSVIAQFESERQALAMMEHPHIAQVFDAGATAAGRPYFVMELVRGEKITDYCDRHSLTLRARLALFVQVCHAIQHAHQKGIIHRDIKPSNILVCMTEEGEPLPKVIDFGIAKATTGQGLTDKTLFTAVDMLIGTPTYMSPEQAAFGSPDVDTRTDIYSLGVLLYELLCGTTPFEVRELLKGGLDEVRRAILNRQPVRPSLRLKVLPAADLATAAQERQTEPPRLIRALRGDLDWIVMKALEKDRSRRYPTANALAMDVQRHLAQEPVAARPPGTLYQVGKLVARNRLLVGGLAVIALLLVGSLAIVTVLLARERAAHGQAEAEKRTAGVEAEKSKKANEILGKMLRSVSPKEAAGQDVTILRSLLDEADTEIRKNLEGQPAIEADLRMMLADSYRDIGDFSSAERMLRRALGIYRTMPSARTKTASAMIFLGFVLISKKEYEEAEQLLLASREIWPEVGAQRELGEIKTAEFLAILRSRQGRGDEAEELMQHVVEWRKRKLKPDDPECINALTNLGLILHDSKKEPESELVYREALQTLRRLYGDQHPIQLSVLVNLGRVTSAQGKTDEERKVLSEAVAIYRKRFHPEHSERLETTLKLADLYRKTAEFAKAEPLYREVIENASGGADDPNPTVAKAVLGLVPTLIGQKNFKEAEALLDEVLTPKFVGEQESLPILELRANFLARTGRWHEAAADAARLVEMQPEMHEHYHRLAPLLVAAGEDEAYRRLCPEIVLRFAATSNVRTADRMAKDCLILPDAVEDLAVVGRMADLALKGGEKDSALPFFQVCKALADFRQGNFAEAAGLAAQVGTPAFKEAEVEALAVRAMALQRMNQAEEARALLERGTTIFETKMSKLESGELRGNWEDWVIARALLKEARTLVEQGEAR